MNIMEILNRIPGRVSLHLESGTLGAAAFSADLDRTYRYLLTRPLSPDRDDPNTPMPIGTTCAFVMLNPSTATADKNDPTIAKCMRFARGWGYEQLIIANAYAYRATDPKALVRERKRHVDVVGEYNDSVIRAVAEVADLVVCAWGSNIEPAHALRVHDLVWAAGRNPHALRITTKTKQPEHPLYLPGALTPIPWVQQ